MLAALTLAALALSPSALALPVNKRTDGGNYGVDEPSTLVLQFAATLEALEATYYQQGLSKFNATDLEAAGFSAELSAAVVKQLGVFSADEQAHSTYLDAALTGAGLDIFYKTCTLDFSSALGSVTDYAAYARAFETIGVGAYIGAAPLLTGSLLVAASTIATVEARHSSFLNALNGGDFSGSPYDISLAPSAVATLVSPYVSGCDLGASLGIAPGTPLGATIDGDIAPGAAVKFTINGEAQIEGFAHFIYGGIAEAVVTGAEQAVIPANATGPVYVYLSGSETPLANDAATVDLSTVFAGPALLFVDGAEPNVLGL